MQARACGQDLGGKKTTIGLTILLCLFLLAGCEPSGDSTLLPVQAGPSPQQERQAIENLVQLYGQAVALEDIDRLQALLDSTPALQTQNVTRQETGALPDAATFRQRIGKIVRPGPVGRRGLVEAMLP